MYQSPWKNISFLEGFLSYRKKGFLQQALTQNAYLTNEQGWKLWVAVLPKWHNNVFIFCPFHARLTARPGFIATEVALLLSVKHVIARHVCVPTVYLRCDLNERCTKLLSSTSSFILFTQNKNVCFGCKKMDAPIYTCTSHFYDQSLKLLLWYNKNKKNRRWTALSTVI